MRISEEDKQMNEGGDDSSLQSTSMLPFFLLLSSSLIYKCHSMNLTDAQSFQQTNRALIRQLFKNYDSFNSPYNTLNSNSSWNCDSYVNVTFMRGRLIELNERQRQFTVSAGIILQYNDPRLTWNPSTFRSISHVYLKQNSVWFPNSAFTYSTFDADELTVNYLGNVLGTYQLTVTYNCDIRNNDFPFDEQLCMICFSLSGYREEELRLRGTAANPPDLYGTGEWNIRFDPQKPTIGMYFGQGEYGISFVYYRLILTRQPNFWISLIIIPTYLLGLLILVGLFFGDGGHLSVNSPVELGLTTMMSMTVIVGILNDSVPKSEDLSRLGYFIFIAIITICSAFVLILLCHNLRMLIHRRTKDKLARMAEDKQSSRPLSFILRLTRNSNTARILLFLLFTSLHTLNLIMMLTKPRDGKGFEALTQSFNVTTTY